ncbi:MAG: M14 family zinc carboxypeptidase [bacterium]|nr:M14 family zinc carboxypeptidase [bacterium]
MCDTIKNMCIAGLMLVLPALIHAEKVVELPISKEEWRGLEKNFKTAEFVRPTEKGIAILIEDEEMERIESLNLPYTIIEDLTLKKKLYYTGKSQYHTFDQMKTELENLASTYSSIAKLDTIGFSTLGRPILCLKISDNPQVNEIEPKSRIVGAIHGNEWIGAEVSFLYAKYLLENYASDNTVLSLVNNREIYIIPILNPDGHVNQSRYNANGVDLNRNFGYIKNYSGSSPYDQPETRAVHEFSKARNFNLSISFHSGATYVNYIWNYTPIRCADDRFNGMVENYSTQYGNLTGYPITEGYDWYQTLGDLNDYSYGINGDIDWTIELSDEYIPDPSQIDPIFNNNKPAMNLFVRKMGQGIGGIVIDSLSGDTIKQARITIYPVDWPIWTDQYTGNFIRPLLPGTYSIKVEAPGYVTKTVSGISVQQDTLTWVNVELKPRNDGKISLFKPEVIYISADNSVITTDTFMTHYALGEPDGSYYSLGDSGYAIFDLGKSIKADTLYVYEGTDNTPNEGFKIYYSESPYGPWTQIGNIHYGNAVIYAGGNSFRYLKIVDDGDGSTSVKKCGYDLDAIVVKTLPEIAILSYNVTELTGNGNGIVNPGEVGKLNITLKNNSPSTVVNLIIKPELQDSYVSFIEDSVILTNVAPNATIPTHLTFNTTTNLPYDYSFNVTIHLNADNQTFSYDLPLKINERTVYVYLGPDDYGYYAYDIMDSVYSEFENLTFRDVSSYGTIISQITNSDDATTQLTLPFTFKYYGMDYSMVSVCTNGWIAMGSTSNNAYENRPIPDPNNPPATIAPFFPDLDPSSNGDIYYYYDPQVHEFIIMWKDVKIWGQADRATFEVILRDPSYYQTQTGDGEIIFLYNTIPQNLNATVGIESPNHATGLLCYFNGEYDPSIAPLASSQFIKFTTDSPEITPIEEAVRPTVFLKNNITRNVLYLEAINFTSGGNVTIYDPTGRVVYQEMFKPGEQKLTLNLSSLRSGVYIVKIDSGKENYSNSYRIIKIE